MNKFIVSFSFALAISFASMAQVPEIDIRLAGSAFYKPFEINGNSYSLDGLGGGLGADVWLVRQFALGASHNRKLGGWIYYTGEYNSNMVFDEDLGNADFVMTEFHVKWTTPRYKRFSFYASPSFYAMQYYYEKLNFGVATTGFGATVGCNIRINQWLKFNIIEVNAIAPTKNIIGENGSKQLFQFSGGLVFQVNRSK